jgi:hypothetical protein
LVHPTSPSLHRQAPPPPHMLLLYPTSPHVVNEEMPFWKTFSILFPIQSKELCEPKMSFNGSRLAGVAERFSLQHDDRASEDRANARDDQ